MWLITLSLSAFCLAVIATIQIQKRRKSLESPISTLPALQSFRYGYLVVLLLANGAEWLQGPYTYALYQQYGYAKDTIALLFIAGYISSMIGGTVAGSLADS